MRVVEFSLLPLQLLEHFVARPFIYGFCIWCCFKVFYNCLVRYYITLYLEFAVPVQYYDIPNAPVIIVVTLVSILIFFSNSDPNYSFKTDSKPHKNKFQVIKNNDGIVSIINIMFIMFVQWLDATTDGNLTILPERYNWSEIHLFSSRDQIMSIDINQSMTYKMSNDDYSIYNNNNQ